MTILFFSDKILNDLTSKKQHNDRTTKSTNTKALNAIRRQRGMAYKQIDGTVVPARKCGAPCNCTKLQCSSKYNDEVRESLLRYFLLLSISAQNEFLSDHLTISYTGLSRVKTKFFNCFSQFHYLKTLFLGCKDYKLKTNLHQQILSTCNGEHGSCV